LISCRGCEGPHDCGDYNSPAWDTAFFVSSGGSWDTEYGNFFLSWYSNLLLQHADRVLAAASEALNKPGRAKRAAKVLKVSNVIKHCMHTMNCWFSHAAHLSSGMVTGLYMILLSTLLLELLISD